MAQPLIKFFRVENKPTTGTPGALYFVSKEGVLYVCTGESSFEAYAGIKSAALDGSVLTLTPSVGDAIPVNIAELAQAAVDLSEYAKTEAVNTAISNAIAAEVERANGAYDEKGAAAAALAAAKEYADGLPHENTTYTFAEGSVNGEFVVTPSDGTAQQVKVHGLGDAAYTTVAALESTMDSKDQAIAEAAATDAQSKADAALASAKAWVEEQKYVTASIINGLATEEYVNNAVKAEADIARGAEKALADRLDIIEGEGEGSIKKAVADAKAAIEGTLADDDAKTLEAINDELDTLAARGYKVAEVTTGLPANIEKRYQLVDQTGAVIEGSVNIDVEKESALKNVELVDADAAGVAGNYLKWTYELADGTEKVQYLDVSQLLVEAEFKNGLLVSAGEVSVKVDAASEAFLSVSADGVKLSGVQNAIDAAAAKATTVVVEGTDAGNNLSIAETAGDDGHPIYTVNLTDVASAEALATLNTEVQEHEEVVAAALVDLNERIDAVADSIPTELGVMSVSEGTDGNFVTTTVDNTDAANPKVSVAVDYVDGVTAGDKLTTNTYVDEHIAAAINAIPAAHVTDVVGDSASYSVVEAPEAGGVHTVKNTLATITVNADNEAAVTAGLATDAFVKTYVENQLSWSAF